MASYEVDIYANVLETLQELMISGFGKASSALLREGKFVDKDDTFINLTVYPSDKFYAMSGCY